MSDRNPRPPCHRKVPNCSTKKTKTCNDRCTVKNNNNNCNLPCSDDPCASTNSGGEHPLRNHLSEALLRQQAGGRTDGGAVGAGFGSPKELEAEVDRLVEYARQWSEKEKFKLKQFYEEEIVRKKKAVIQEFKCAMEREVIAPLKTKLCEYEKEIHNLRSQLEEARGGVKCPEVVQAEVAPVNGVGGEASDSQNNKETPIVLDIGVVDKAIEKARKSNRQLQKVIHLEKRRKSTRSASQATTVLKGADKSRLESVKPSGEDDEAVEEGGGEEDMAELGLAEGEEEDTAVVEDIIDKLLQSKDLNDDTRAVVKKVKDLTDALISTKNFTEEEIKDLIKESELAEGFKKQVGELQIENEELKRRIAELLKQLESMQPNKGSVDEENMQLRQRIQELEGERTRGSLQNELDELKKQLEELWVKNEEEKTRSESRLELIPEEEGEVPDGGDEAIKSTPQSAGGGGASRNGESGPGTPKTPGTPGGDIPPSAPGSRKNSGKSQSPVLSKGPSAKTISNKGSGGVESTGQKSPKALSEKAESIAQKSAEKVPSEKAESIAQKSAEKVPGEKAESTGQKSRAGSINSVGSGKSRKKSLPLSLRSMGLSARSVGEITGPFEEQIKSYLGRIAELEDHLSAMAELEARLKELEDQVKEMEALRLKMKEMQDELEELRAKECPICPVPSETELKALKKKMEETEAFLEKKVQEFNDLNDRLHDMQKANESLQDSVASFKAVEKKNEELETMHAQVLEEKRRKSLEARELGAKVSQLEADYLAALKELEKLRADLKDAEERARDGDQLRKQLEDEIKDLKAKQEAEMENLKKRYDDEMRDLKRKLDENNNNVEDLKRQLKEKEGELEDLRGQTAALVDEANIAKRRLEEALKDKERLDRELDTVKRHCDQVQNDLMRQMRDQQKKCSEACDALSKRGQCILEHEKKCMNVTSQMEKDNDELRGKLRQMQDQLDAMVSMEQVTRALHGQMQDFHRRAQERGRELEELKKLPETCDLKNMESTTSSNVLPSPLFSLPSLPTPSQVDWNPSSNSGGNGAGGGHGGSSSEQCKMLSSQLNDLEKEKDELSSELKGKLRAVEDINRQLDDLQNKDKKLREEKDKACK